MIVVALFVNLTLAAVNAAVYAWKGNPVNLGAAILAFCTFLVCLVMAPRS